MRSPTTMCIVAVPVVRVRWPYRIWATIMGLALAALAAGPWIDASSYDVGAYATARSIPWPWWTLGFGLGAVSSMSAAVWGRRFSWVWSSVLVIAPAAMWTWCIWWERFIVADSILPVAALVAWTVFLAAPLWVYAVNRSRVYVIVARPIEDRRASP